MTEYQEVWVIEDDEDLEILNIERSKFKKPGGLVERKGISNLKGLGYYLPSGYDHKIVRDSAGVLVLISIRQK